MNLNDLHMQEIQVDLILNMQESSLEELKKYRTYLNNKVINRLKVILYGFKQNENFFGKAIKGLEEQISETKSEIREVQEKIEQLEKLA